MASFFFMPIREQGSAIEPQDGPLHGLTELARAINTAAKLLTPAEARAIYRELTSVARALKQISYAKPSRQRTTKATTRASAQGDLLG